MTLTGTVRFLELEGGHWVLEADDGRRLLLAGGDRGLKRDGARVRVEGSLDAASLTVAMVGPRFVVARYAWV